MNKNIKYILGKAWIAVVAGLALAACSDEWDDHYKPDATSGSGTTLWEAISSNSNLSNFAKVLKGCGYDRNLNGSLTYSVFAPTNSALSSEQADSLVQAYQEQKARGVRDDDNTVIKQFVQNHMALFSKSVSTLTDDTLTMCNKKYEPLTPTSIGGVQFATSNELHSNGLLYTLDKRISYYPNIFEYLGLDHDIDSVYNFINSYSRYEFDENSSVPGGIVDGQTVYLDSVVYRTNNFLSSNGLIDSEDSTYLMLVPTNDQWNKLVSEYHDYYVYPNTVAKHDSMQEANCRSAIINGTIFSRTINSDAAIRDSAVSTTAIPYSLRKELDLDSYGVFYNPYGADGIFNGATPIQCSNGQVLKTSNFRVDKRNTFLQTIKVEAERTVNLDTLIDAADPLVQQYVTSGSEFYNKISSNGYVDVLAQNTSDDENHFPLATVQYNIPNVLSNVPYDIYVVYAPQKAANPYISDDQLLPNRVVTTLFWVNKDNMRQSRRLGAQVTDPTKVDTIQVAKGFTFPTCSLGLTTPTVKVRLQNNVSRNQTSRYSQDMHIDCIIFKPHEE